MTKEIIGDGNTDGTVFGQSSEKIGFYGSTAPATKPSSTAAASISTAAARVASSVAASSAYGFTSAQADGIIKLVNSLRANLVTLGIIGG